MADGISINWQSVTINLPPFNIEMILQLFIFKGKICHLDVTYM